ncbi:PPE domain-containing protein [Mycolicibacillus parakoreensis]|uniref:PPE domain-containing protein n=1 Tax=Mycolicibacillus parakoreensis TaxID=1069221 RepID=A0ABY3U1P2_9MYCO|nr:PPE family protein [Mycolicibacillus parakoreensis]MCV7314892.1 PPE domain-containing protein [Mycolicibacillus parakoreensis]ULN53886.1 PPE domain-containing protein [Mycolicibacillus parakoreensis]
MVDPVWLATPPEVHAALLTAGPGPAALLGAAEAWHMLAAEYAAVATELTLELATVQASAWQGPSAEAYLSAHGPYLAWLNQTSCASTRAATLHHRVADAYSVALAAMPTPAELAANHTTHAVLTATNFFGINTIPIALNEADYVRMWIQAATTMTIYEAASRAALATAPPTRSAPPVLRRDSPEARRTPTPPDSAIQDPAATLRRMLTDFLTNPTVALATWGPLLFTIGYNVVPWPLPFYLGPAAALALPLVLGAGLGRLAEVSRPPLPTPPAVDDSGRVFAAGDPPARPEAPVASDAPATTMPSSPSTSAMPAGAAVSGASAPVAPGIDAIGYLVTAVGPDDDPGPGARGPGTTGVPGTALPAGVPAPEPRVRSPRRHRRRSTGSGHGDEFADLDDTAPTVQASDQRAGFRGTAIKADAPRAAGATVHETVPLLPETWTDAGPSAGTDLV